MPSDPIRLRLLEAAVARLANIKRVQGYHTDAGAALFVGFVPAIGEDDPDVVLAVTVGDDTVRSSLQKKSLQLPIEVHVLTRVDREVPWPRAERARADVLAAFETEDRRLGGFAVDQITYSGTSTREREPGSLDVGLTVTYLVPYTEAWGNPASI